MTDGITKQRIIHLDSDCVSAGWGFWILWTAGTAVGGIVGFLLGFGMGRYACCPIAEIIGRPAGFATGVVLLGTIVGLIQWLMLRTRITQPGWWILASAVGALAGSIAGFVSPAVISPTAETMGTQTWVGIGASFGIAVGLVQWLFLQRHMSRAGWWILASGVCGGLAWLLGSSSVLEVADFVLWMSDGRIAVADVAFWTFGGALYFVVSGPLMGGVLVGLVRTSINTGASTSISSDNHNMQAA